jgi:hypothetical protein
LCVENMTGLFVWFNNDGMAGRSHNHQTPEESVKGGQLPHPPAPEETVINRRLETAPHTKNEANLTISSYINPNSNPNPNPNPNPNLTSSLNNTIWERFSISYWHNQLWQGEAAYRFDERINASDLFESQAYTGLVRVRCAFFIMDSALLGLGSSGCGCCTVRVFRQNFTPEDASGSHACLQSIQQSVTEFMVSDHGQRSRMPVVPTPARL